MNVFNKVTLESLKLSRTRTVVTVIGVILSAALITAVTTFGVSLVGYMAKGAGQKYGGWHVDFMDADAALIEACQRDQSVEKTVACQNLGYAAFDGGTDPDRPYLSIMGFDKAAFSALPLTLLSGRLPQNAGEIVLSGKAMLDEDAAVAVGDTLSLAVGSRRIEGKRLCTADPFTPGETLDAGAEQTYTVVGLCQTPPFEMDGALGYTAITLAGGAAESTSLFVTLKSPFELHRFLKNMAEDRPYKINNLVLRFLGLSDEPDDRVFKTFFFSAGAVVISIIMLGSIFLIYNSFNISLNERTRQFGILASVGATARQLKNSVLFEGLCIGAVGIPLGVLFGVGCTAAVIRIVAKRFAGILYTGIPLTLVVSVPAILAAAVISLVTILISAYIPAKRAASTPIMDCIRQTNEIKVTPKDMKTPKVIQRICGLEGLLALKNFKRNRKRYRSIVLSLAFSVILFISTSAFVMNVERQSAQTKTVTDYDIGLGTTAMDDAKLIGLYERLKTAGGVRDGSYQFVMEKACSVPVNMLTENAKKAVSPNMDRAELTAVVQVLDDASYRGILEKLGLDQEAYLSKDAPLIAVAKMEDNADAEGVQDLGNLFCGADVKLSLFSRTEGAKTADAARAVRASILEFVPPDTPPSTRKYESEPYYFHILAPYSRMDSLLTGEQGEIFVKGLGFQSDTPSNSIAEMEAMIADAGITEPYLFLNMSKMLEEGRNYIFIANVFIYTFIVLISLIAVANVFNTISTNIKLRRRELAMLRSVGMSEGDFQRMMNFECAFYGLRALIFGLPLSAVAAYLIHLVMFTRDVPFAFPWSSVALSIVGVLSIVFITMLYAVSKIKRENIIDALRDDMT